MKTVSLAHGAGGRLMHELLEDVFFKILGNPILNKKTDSAILTLESRNICFTTDSFVVNPIFFPGSDIGKLSIFGTVNDLCVMGAIPKFISLSMIIEEGLDFDILNRVVRSVKFAADKSGVRVVTGDTKVVNKSKADLIFINTAGIGILKYKIYQNRAKPGDKIIINGNIADHGMAVLSARENLPFKNSIKSDCVNLNGLADQIFKTGVNIKFMRDVTRGGLATTLNELAESIHQGIELDEQSIPIGPKTKTICDILGLDPLYIANEGKLIVLADKIDAKKILKAIKNNPLGRNAAIIGEVKKSPKKMVWLKKSIGTTRIIDMLIQDQLPRIC